MTLKCYFCIHVTNVHKYYSSGIYKIKFPDTRLVHDFFDQEKIRDVLLGSLSYKVFLNLKQMLMLTMSNNTHF